MKAFLWLEKEDFFSEVRENDTYFCYIFELTEYDWYIIHVPKTSKKKPYATNRKGVTLYNKLPSSIQVIFHKVVKQIEERDRLRRELQA